MTISSSNLRFTNPPSYVEHQACKFVIMDAPNDANLPSYINELNQLNVKTIVRVCEPSYSGDSISKEGMKVVDMAFPDGQPPTKRITDQWLKICETENIQHRRPVAVHCVAGLGRAPVLVAIALMEMTGMDAMQAVKFIRNIRRGAINERHATFLRKYQACTTQDCLNNCVVL